MPEAADAGDTGARIARDGGRSRRVVFALVGIVGLYSVVAYVVMPMLLERYVRRHPALADMPRFTHAGDGMPGDPLNVAFVGSEEDLQRAMLGADWYPADPITLRSSLRIAVGTVLHRPYDDAPVSSLYLFGRREDLAFEQPVGDSPRQRHHVRLWRTTAMDEGRPLWVGAATFDRSVGVSHETGAITHHIAADIDAERDHLMQTLTAAGGVVEVDPVADFHEERTGRNGGGDPWHTDGTLLLGILRDTSGVALPEEPAKSALLELFERAPASPAAGGADAASGAGGASRR